MAINIRGIEINDRSDIEDILSAFSILSSEIEILKNELSEQLISYNDLSNNLIDDYSNRKELLQAISNLQIQAKELLNYYNSLKNSISNELQTKLEYFNVTLQNNIKNSLKKIDTSSLENAMKEKLQEAETNISDIYATTQNLTEYIKKNLDRQTENTSKMLEKQTNLYKNIKQNLSNLNSQVKNLNVKAIVISSIMSMLFGISLMSGWAYYKVKLNSNKIFLQKTTKKILPDAYNCELENGKKGICAYFEDPSRLVTKIDGGVFIEIK